MSTKIYAVHVTAGIGQNASQQTRLVRAKTRAGAAAFVAACHITANLATQDELVSATTAGVKVEDSTTESPGQPQLPGTDPTGE